MLMSPEAGSLGTSSVALPLGEDFLEYRYGMESNTLAGIVWNTLVILTAIYDMYLNGTPFHSPGQCYWPGFCHPPLTF